MASTIVQNGFQYCMQNEKIRSITNFSPSLWGDLFLSFSFDDQVWRNYNEELEVMKEEVRRKLHIEGVNIIERMILIDTLERLGVSYHFEEEIEELLKHIFDHNSCSTDAKDHNLFTTALQFRLFRQHGYKLPSSVFEKFMDRESGTFKESLTGDVKGMLSLYEATDLRVHGEDILEKALAFTTAHLKSMAPKLNSPLKEQVIRALDQTLHRGIPRVETRHFIAVYEKEESKSDLLLRFAKLDFNLVQMLHKKELHDLCRWWKELDLQSKVTYARTRIVESYFWGAALHFEPQYSFARCMVAKAIAFVAVLDDTYDTYGTLEELQVFTDILERWNIKEIDELPDYMKPIYEALSKFFDECAQEVKEQARSHAAYYAKRAMIQLAQGYHMEAKWFIGKKMPSFDEYIENGIISSSYNALMSASFLGIKSAQKGDFEWLMSGPKIHVAISIIGRIWNDLASYKRERKDGQVPTPIDCYMQHYGASEEDTLDKFLEIVGNAWKDVNEELLAPSPVSREILKLELNLARITHVSYKYSEDAYTNPEKVAKAQIIALFVDSIPI